MQHGTSGSQDKSMSSELKEMVSFEFSNGESKFSIDASDMLDFVEMQYEPEDVFSEDELGEWALANGFVKEE